MASPNPRTSIIIPAYGVAEWIGEAIESVMRQRDEDWELILVNDGSPDTPALEVAIAPYRGRIQYLVQDDAGAAAARNRALAEARGEWVAFLDGDECWQPEYLDRQLNELGKRRLDLVWSDGVFMGDSPRAGTRMMSDYHCRGPVTVEALISARVHVITSTTVVRRTAIEAAGGFDKRLRRAQDFDLWVRMVRGGVRAGYHRRPMIRYRLRPNNLTGDALARVERELAVFARLQEKLALTPGEAAAIRHRSEFLEATQLLIFATRALGARDCAATKWQSETTYRRHPTVKLGLIQAMVCLVPGLMRSLYLARTRTGYR